MDTLEKIRTTSMDNDAKNSQKTGQVGKTSPIEPPLSDVDLLSFTDDGKQPDYLDLPVAKEENGQSV